VKTSVVRDRATRRATIRPRGSRGLDRIRVRWAAAASSIALALLAGASLASAALPPLIPRATLFAPPERGAPQISPDGARLAWRATPADGPPSIWMRTIGGHDSTRVATDPNRPVYRTFWAGDGKHFLFLQDSDGDENWHVYSTDLSSGAVRDLTPYSGARAEDVFVDPAHPDRILVGLNLRDRSVFDIHRVDLKTGTVTLDTQNPGDVLAWTTDNDFVIRAATAIDPKDGTAIIRVRDRAGAPWRDLVRWSFAEAGSDRYQKVLAFTRDGKSLLVQSPVGSNTTRLVTIDLATGRETGTLASDPQSDLWNQLDFAGSTGHVGVWADPATGKPLAVAFNYLIPKWRAVDPAARADLAALEAAHRGVFDFESSDAAGTKWIIRYIVDDGPDAFYLYDRARHEAEFLYEDRPALENLTLARTRGVAFHARDGLEIPAYLTTPPGAGSERLPLVLLVHGGPWFRDEWGYDPEVQWLANRGYAVFQIEYRGSTGFGNQFVNASNGAMGVGGMQSDLTDGVRWAIQQGIADSTRVAIMGGSYGGYATLCGLTFTPDLYRCGVDIVGPSNIKTLIESFPPYWALRKKRWLLRIGNVLEDDALNQRISPLFHVDRIKAPVLIGHGVNDPRAKFTESEQIVRALRDNKKDVTFVAYPNEGHGFSHPQNAQDFNGRAEEFLAKHLGGRAEKWEPVPGSTAEVR
jgi:dipeptidyl aminopeptidase/acylaminoacyl peptidase